MRPSIRPREEWAVDRPATGPLSAEEVRFLLIHHSATGNEYPIEDVPILIRGFFDYHVSPEKGWPDIAYNFLIDRFGQVWEGRTGSLAGPVAGDATGGNQGYSQLICLIGDFTNAPLSLEALDSLVSTLAWLAGEYRLTVPGEVEFVSRGSNLWPEGTPVKTGTISGHRDMSRTACPGNELYSLIEHDLRQRVSMVSTPTTETFPVTTTTREAPAVSTPLARARGNALRGSREEFRSVTPAAVAGIGLAALLGWVIKRRNARRE